MKNKKLKIILFLIVLFIFSFQDFSLAQTSYSITNTSNTTNPTFAPNFSSTPTLPNPSFTDSSGIRIRVCGNQNTATNQMAGTVTRWELRAMVSGLDNPVNLTNGKIQYSDITVSNIVTSMTGVFTATVTPNTPATFQTILDSGNNYLILSGTGATTANTMAATCTAAMNGTDTRYWNFMAGITFTHDFYFLPQAYLPTLTYTLTCTMNCF